MSKTYTVLDQTHKMMGGIYSVLVDNMTGFDDFILDHGDALPGTTVDVADFRRVLRLRHDGSWEELYDYSSGDPEATEEAVAAVLEDLVSDEELEGMMPEKEETE